MPLANAHDTDPEALLVRFLAGDRGAISRVVTEFERSGPLVPALLSRFAPLLGRALVVGFTGPPGAGKSTLVNAYVTDLRQNGERLAIVAVDPSSPISGGAILGDRIRMTTARDDQGVFMRSLASRGALGGLSPAAVRVIDALDAAGNATIVLETVGTGQSEIDIAEIADVRVVLAAPGLGDDIQAMKAGLLEIADIMVVNKADRPGADATRQQLAGALSLRHDRADVPVLKTTATTGAGVSELKDAIARVAERRLADGPIVRRRRRARYLIARAAADIVAARIRAGAGGTLDTVADDVLSGALSAEAAAALIIGGI